MQSFTGSALLRIPPLRFSLHIQDYHLLWLSVPTHSISLNLNLEVLQPRSCLNNFGLGYSPFARHYLGNHYCFLFLQVLRCFSSLGSPLSIIGLPHSEISGSWDACAYPELIAACHVLHRLQMPRHPPYTLPFFLLIRSFTPSLSWLYQLHTRSDSAPVHSLQHVK